VARTYEYQGLTIDGQPEGLNISDPNDHIASRAWIDYIFIPATCRHHLVHRSRAPAFRSCGFGTSAYALQYNVRISNDLRGAGMAEIR